MRTATLAAYGQLADQEARFMAQELDPDRGFMGLNDPSTAALRCFRAFHKDAHLTFVDVNGVTRWMTAKQARVHAILMRHAVSGVGTITQKAIAAEALCTPSTVSRAVLKFQSWGIFAMIVFRGRNGGMHVILRWATDKLERFAVAAKARIRAQLLKVASRERARREDHGRTVDVYGKGRNFYRKEPLSDVGRPWTTAEIDAMGLA